MCLPYSALIFVCLLASIMTSPKTMNNFLNKKKIKTCQTHPTWKKNVNIRFFYKQFYCLVVPTIKNIQISTSICPSLCVCVHSEGNKLKKYVTRSVVVVISSITLNGASLLLTSLLRVILPKSWNKHLVMALRTSYHCVILWKNLWN